MSSDQNPNGKTLRILFKISNTINASQDLDYIFKKVYEILCTDLGVTNFYICLFEKETNKIEFPFHYDEFDDLSVWKTTYLETDSLTHELIASEKPLLLNSENLEDRSVEKKIIGTLPKVWMGIPLRIRGQISGCIVTQHYHDPQFYTDTDIPFFNSVAEQLALAVDRGRSESKISQAQGINQTLLNISNAINTSRNLHELYKSIHVSLGKIIDLTNFIIALYDDKSDNITFEYYVDPHDDMLGKTVPLKRSIGRDIIRLGKPLFLNAQALVERIGKDEGVGTQPKIWLGVPLKVENTVIGYMGTQSYTDPFLFNKSDLDVFSSVSDQVALAIDRKRTADTIRYNEILTQTLYRISNSVNTTDNLDELYKTIYESLNRLIPLPNFFIAIVNKEKKRLTFPFFIDEHDTKESFIQGIDDYEQSTSNTTRIIFSKKPLLLTEAMLKEKYRQKKTIGTNAKVWLGVPLMIKDDVIGAIVVQHYEDAGYFSEGDIELLTAVTDQVAIAIDRKKEEEARKKSEQINRVMFSIANAVNITNNLDSLYQSIHQSLAAILDVTNFVIGVYNPKKDVLQWPYYVDEYSDSFEEVTDVHNSGLLSSEVIKSAQPFLIRKEGILERAENMATEIFGTLCEQWLGVPLKIKNEVIGLIIVQSYSDPERYTQEDVDILLAVSDQIAMAIERKQSEENIKKSQSLTSTLFSISNAVNTTDRLPALFNSIYESLNALIELPNFFICIYRKETNSMYFPFYIDEYDSEETISFTVEDIGTKDTITTDVINGRKPLFLTRDILEQKARENKIVGKVPLIWLGIPLIIRDEVIGVMAVQHYSDPEYFTTNDMDLFVSISDQVALAIDRKQSQEIIIEREKQILELSRQTEELSLVAASSISMKDEKAIFNHISKAIVANSDYQQLIISYFKDEPPYREILGHRGISDEKINKIADFHVPKKHFEHIFKKGEKIGHFTCYLSHEKNDVLSQDLVSLFIGEKADNSTNEWHPNDLLFIPMYDAEENLMGVISVGNSKSGNRPTSATVRPLEIFSSLISQIIIVRKIQNELKDHKENLEKIVEGRTKELTAEITERIQVEKKLQKAKVDAEAAAQAKLEFLANMSHEIRTPINGVMGMAELALEQDIPGDLRRIFTTIDSEADNLLKIINEILDFSKIEAGKLEIEEIHFDLRTVFEKTCTSLAMGLSDDRIEFVSFMAPDVPSCLIGDPGRLRQILVNLTSNAIKFTEKGEIFVACEQLTDSEDSTKIKFTVKDTGIGIPKEKQDRIFESFSQADGSTTRKYGGTGLGTTISKQLVELMGGRIGLESNVNKGSTFWFTVNFKKQKSSGKHVDIENKAIIPDNLRILVAVNNYSNQLVFETYLGSFGYDPVIVSTAEQASEQLTAGGKDYPPFDLIIMDLTFPQKNGFELAEHVRGHAGPSRIPIIMLTSTGKAGDGSRCRDIGINGYLTKPIKKEELKTMIGMVMGKLDGSHPDEESLVTRHSMDEEKAGQIKILLVEDYPTNQKIALRHLKNVGYQVTLAENGRQSVDYYKKQHFDLVLMDIQMPEMDGYEATRHIREYEEKINHYQMETEIQGDTQRIRTPVIAMTAHAIKGYREKCLEAGMDDYISKPLKKKNFLDMVSKWIMAVESKEKIAFPADKKSGFKKVKTKQPVRTFDFEKALDEFENDREFLAEIIEGFLKNLTGQLKTISNAISRNDAKTVAHQAHTIKGGAANLTAYPMSETAHELEKIGKSGNLENSRKVFSRLKADFENLKHDLIRLGL